MKINDVMKDSKIKIHATINGHGILLITKAEVGVRDGLLVDSLTYFDEDLVFSEPSKVVVVNKRDGRSYEFTSSRIGPVETRYGKFHLVRCTDEGKIVNRRQAERYDIDRLGVIRIGENKDIRNALVYDISMRGIAFILDSGTEVKKGDHIIASFRYDPNYFHFYACEATVVRIFTMNGQPAIGCTLDAMGADLVTLISSKRKEKMGIRVDDILDIAESPDEKIASGDKIPVNYVPQLAVSKEYEKEKHAHKWELEEKTDAPLMSPEEAADLIPERSADDIIKARAERVADVSDLSEMDSEEPVISPEDLAELATIEDRTPGKQKSKGSSEDETSQQKSAPKNVAFLTHPKPKGLMDYVKELDSIEERPPKDKMKQLEDLTALEGEAFKPSRKTKKKLDFISSIVGGEVASSENMPKPSKADKSKSFDPSQIKSPKAGQVDLSNHQARFVDAYQKTPGGASGAGKAPASVAEGPADKKERTVAKGNAQPQKHEGSKSQGFFPEDYDGYFNQNGHTVDERMFMRSGNDGFLTPEQIADIIELERISKNE